MLDEIRTESPGPVTESLERLLDAVELIDATKTGTDISIGAELFPKLSSDRKEAAAFYTQAHNAEFLSAMTITDNMADWSDPALFDGFRICDLACGTGTLLRFAYAQIEAYHQAFKGRKKPNVEKLHKNAMEHGLYGVDVSPIAAHLTSAGLAMRSTNPYSLSNIGWVSVGDMRDDRKQKIKKRDFGAIKTGSIEYITASAITDMAHGMFGHSTGRESLDEHFSSVKIADGAFDVILMNPPYSRTRGGQSAFDIAGLSEEERKLCQEKWGDLVKEEPCVKTAGMAATYLCIARRKIRPGGMMGFVLPRTAAYADTWKVTRNMIECEFEDITVVATQSGKAIGRNAISADTNMEEMFLVARKKAESDGQRSDVRCVTLYEPILRLGVAIEMAKAVRAAPKDGPVIIGSEIGVSRMFKTLDGAGGGAPWSSVGVVGDSINDISIKLREGKLIGLDGEVIGTIPITRLDALFDVGPTHHLIGHISGKDDIGAFTFNRVLGDNDSMGRYRSLWSVDSKVQTSMMTHATHKGVRYRDEKADAMWDTRSNLFICRNVRWTSQKLVAAITSNDVMGGPSYTSLGHKDERVKKAFAMWANSIYGMMTYWSIGGRAQTRRSRLQVGALGSLKCPDFSSFGDKRLDAISSEFDRLSEKELAITNQADSDKVRDEINEKVSAMMGFGNYDARSVTKLWCAEPSVRKPKMKSARETLTPD